MTRVPCLLLIWIISNEAVCHHDEGQVSPGDVLHRHHCCQPDPPVPLLQVNCIQEIHSSSSEFSNHAKCQKRFSSVVIAPTTDVEGKEDGNEMLCPGSYCFKAHHLKWASIISQIQLNWINLIFNIIIISCISVILDILAEFHRKVKLFLYKDANLGSSYVVTWICESQIYLCIFCREPSDPQVP